MFSLDFALIKAITDFLISISFYSHTVKGGLIVLFFTVAYGWAIFQSDCNGGGKK